MSSAHLSYRERREQASLDAAVAAETDEQYAARCYRIYADELETIAFVERTSDKADLPLTPEQLAKLRERARTREVRRDFGRPAYGRKPSPGYGLPW